LKLINSKVIEKGLVQKAFVKALCSDNKSGGNLFHEIRKYFQEEIEKAFNKQESKADSNQTPESAKSYSGKMITCNPIEDQDKEVLGPDYCSRYGFDDYSIKGINYTKSEYNELPSLLPFVKTKEFSIGNLAVSLENIDYNAEISTDIGIKIAGYSFYFLPKKKKSILHLYGIRFSKEVLQPLFDEYFHNCSCNKSDLDEIRIGINSYPIIFICRKCGQLYTCKCFEKYLNLKKDIIGLPCGHSHSGVINHKQDGCELKKAVENIKIKDSICHLCTGSIPKLEYGNEMYYSAFLRKYLPYFELLKKQPESEHLKVTEKLSKEMLMLEKEAVEIISKSLKYGKELKLLNKQCVLPPQLILDGKREEYLHLVAQGMTMWKSVNDNYISILFHCIVKEIKNDISVLQGKEKEVFTKYCQILTKYDKANTDFVKGIENDLRKRVGYPLIGEKWISETMLYKITQTLFADKTTLFHYRGKELHGLELDIFIVDLKIGIEYQGVQHYETVSHWGGDEGLTKRRENDKKKKEYCKKEGYNLIEFKYDESLTIENVEKYLGKYLGRTSDNLKSEKVL